MMTLYCSQRSLKEALELFDALVALHVPIGRRVIDSLLRLLGTHRRYHDAMRVFTHAASRADSFTYGALIFAAVRSGERDEALAWARRYIDDESCDFSDSALRPLADYANDAVYVKWCEESATAIARRRGARVWSE
jgi:hypothetical protein